MYAHTGEVSGKMSKGNVREKCPEENVSDAIYIKLEI